MPTAVRETVLAWAKTRLDTIAGFAKFRNPNGDDLFGSLPALVMLDGGEEPVEGDSGETVFEVEITLAAAVRATGAASGEAAGTALSDALAKIHNAIMPAANWPPELRRARPGPRVQVDFISDAQAAEDVVALGAIFYLEYATDDEDAYVSSH